jgi:hypothetical protein
MPLVTVGLPVYNGATLVGSAIESILGQTFRNFELIISDNGSTDATEAICRRYAALDPRIRYYRSPVNRGGTWNFNRVFELATGPYFKWAAHDDMCKPRFLECCVDILEKYPQVVVCYPKTAVIDDVNAYVGDYDDGFDLGSSKACERLRQCIIVSSRCNPVFGVIRSATLATTPLMGNYVANDYILLAQLALRGQFYEVPERLFLRREHNQRATQACHSLSEHLMWFDPNNTRRLPIRRLRLMVEYFRSVNRAPLSTPEAVRCYILLLRWLRWHWRSLTGEGLSAIRYCLTFKPHTSSA